MRAIPSGSRLPANLQRQDHVRARERLSSAARAAAPGVRIGLALLTQSGVESQVTLRFFTRKE
ncbi:MAG: hypothetical protein ACRD1P_02605 [Thermoanaerobaculia bacterium]